jgi:hypothetical protein
VRNPIRLRRSLVGRGGLQSTTLHTAPLAFRFEVSWSTARRGVGGGPSTTMAPLGGASKEGGPVGRKTLEPPTDPPDAQTFVNLPDWIRSTRVFHSSLLRTARFPVSPIRTSSSAISTSGHSPQPAGQSKTFTFSMCDCPPF